VDCFVAALLAMTDQRRDKTPHRATLETARMVILPQYSAPGLLKSFEIPTRGRGARSIIATRR